MQYRPGGKGRIDAYYLRRRQPGLLAFKPLYPQYVAPASKNDSVPQEANGGTGKGKAPAAVAAAEEEVEEEDVDDGRLDEVDETDGMPLAGLRCAR